MLDLRGNMGRNEAPILTQAFDKNRQRSKKMFDPSNKYLYLLKRNQELDVKKIELKPGTRLEEEFYEREIDVNAIC